MCACACSICNIMCVLISSCCLENFYLLDKPPLHWRDARKLGLDAHKWYGIAQGGMNYLKSGKVPRGPSVVTDSFV